MSRVLSGGTGMVKAPQSCNFREAVGSLLGQGISRVVDVSESLMFEIAVAKLRQSFDQLGAGDVTRQLIELGFRRGQNANG